VLLLAGTHEPFEEPGLLVVSPVLCALGSAVEIESGVGVVLGDGVCSATLPELGIHGGVDLLPLCSRRGAGGGGEGERGRGGGGMAGSAWLSEGGRGGGRVTVVGGGAVVRGPDGGEMSVERLPEAVRMERCLGRELKKVVQMVESGDTPSHLDPGLGLCDPAMVYGCTASSTRCTVISQSAFAHPENTTHFCCESIQQSSHSELNNLVRRHPQFITYTNTT